MTEVVYTCAELARLSGMSVRSIYYYIYTGQMPCQLVRRESSPNRRGPKTCRVVKHDDAVAVGILKAKKKNGR